MQPVLVIPAYQPTNGLEGMIAELHAQRPNIPIIVVNDGSDAVHRPAFDRLTNKGVTCLTHAINLGKGQALKTAINHVLTHFSATTCGIVTADADGQHSTADIIQICDALLAESDTLWIGARAFDKDVPLRSQFGNTVTRHVFKLLVGRVIRDTQSGLRGIPRKFLPDLLRLKSTRYEFELDMLVEAAQQGMPIKECDIETIYIEENASSHFRPLIDSLRIYFIFIRFCALSIITAIVDFIVFSISFWCGSTVLMSFCMARIVAGSFNFLVGKRMIFKSRANILPEAIKFALLVFTLMCISYVLVNAMVSVLGLPVLMSKLLAEFGLFLLSFAAQRILVFSRANEAVPAA